MDYCACRGGGRGQWDRRSDHKANVHTATIEGFWAQVKNAVNGVHHGVAPEYLQHPHPRPLSTKFHCTTEVIEG